MSIFRRRRKRPEPEYDYSRFMPPEPTEQQAEVSTAPSREAEEFDWLDHVLRPILLALMNVWVVRSFITVAESISGEPLKLEYLQVMVFLASLEGIHSDRLTKRLGLRGAEEKMRLKLAEVVVLLLALKLASYAPVGLSGLLRSVRHWSDSFAAFLDPRFLFGGTILLIFWWLAISLSRDFALIGVQPGEIGPDPTSPEYDLWAASPGRHMDRGAVLRRIRGKFFWGGGILLICAGVTQVGPETVLIPDRPSFTGVILNVLIYFFIGLALIGQAQFLVQRARWQLQKIPVADNIAPQWAVWAGVLALLVSVGSVVLPTRHSLGILAVAAGLLPVILYVLVMIAIVTFGVVSYLFSLIMGRGATGPGGGGQKFPRPPQIAQAGGQGLTIPEILKDAIFWSVVLGIVGYSLYNYISYRGGPLRLLSKVTLLRTLLRGLAKLWRGMRGLLRTAMEKVKLPTRESIIPRMSRARLPARLLRLSRLSPRELVHYFYLSTLRRAARLGFQRQSHQTPYEYSSMLKVHLSEVEEELTELTEAFVEARYGPRPVTQSQAEALQAPWQRVRSSLRQLRRELRRHRGPI